MVTALLNAVVFAGSLMGYQEPPNFHKDLSDSEVAQLDWELHGKDFNYRYISFDRAPHAHSRHWGRALKFSVCSHSLSKVIEQHVPVPVSEHHSVYRINLSDLGWPNGVWEEAIKDYPYSERKNPLVIRGDWFIDQLNDDSESKVGTLLLYSGKPPATKKEFLDFWKVKEVEPFGLVEAESRVAVNKIRWLQHFDRFGGTAWGTKDFLRIKPKDDPLEQPLGNFKHDGEEFIVQFRKISIDYNLRGALQAYTLFDGEGKIVAEAPVKLVEDHNKYKGLSSIRPPGSCVICHPQGINGPSKNALIEVLDAGVQLSAKMGARDKITEFHLGDTTTQVQRDQIDYNNIVESINHGTPQENIESFNWAWRWYWQEINIEQAALELGCKKEELTNALAYATVGKVEIGVRLSSLVHGKSIPRSSWEDLYLGTQGLLKNWRAK